MTSFNTLWAIGVTAAVATIAGPAAAATDYQAYITGTLVSAAGAVSSFSQGTGNQPFTPVQFGRTGTTWQVGSAALAQDGGEAAANVDLAPPDYSHPNDHAQNLTAHGGVDYLINLVGSGNDALVPVEVKALGSISWTQNGDATAVFKFQDYDNRSAFTPIRRGPSSRAM